MLLPSWTWEGVRFNSESWKNKTVLQSRALRFALRLSKSIQRNLKETDSLVPNALVKL